MHHTLLYQGYGLSQGKDKDLHGRKEVDRPEVRKEPNMELLMSSPNGLSHGHLTLPGSTSDNTRGLLPTRKANRRHGV